MSTGYKAGIMAGLVLVLVACQGNYSGGTATSSASGSTGAGETGSEAFSSPQGFFKARVQPNLNFCRTCHVPGGVADVEDGKLFMLSHDTAQDWDNLKAAWQAVGEVDGQSRLLTMPSGTDPKSHSAGTPWPEGSPAYASMAVMLQCFANPEGCLAGAADTGTDPLQQWPLLTSSPAQTLWAEYCANQPDAAALPVDPRTLVQKGIIAQDKAVYYNAFWQDCHVNLPPDQQRATTCGEYRKRRDRGLYFLQHVLPSAASTQTAAEFNNAWKKWGLSSRPENFEEMYTLRYGFNRAPFHNPYPLPGEDPNATNGGSGQLPLGLSQIKDADGKWTGIIGQASCFQCHGGQMGDPWQGDPVVIGAKNLGLGNNNFDLIQYSQDNGAFAGTPLSTAVPSIDLYALFNIGIKQRGQNNAVGAFELLITMLDFDSLGFLPNPAKTILPFGVQGIQDMAHPLAHTQDTPAWWNFGFRPRKFFDAGVSNDSTRIIMAAGPSDTGVLLDPTGKPYRDLIKEWDLDLATYFLSLESPQWPFGFCGGDDGAPAAGDDPRCISKPLAKQGAVLFHTLDLWSRDGNKDRPKPLGGNGSCASCHGAYSPRFVHDPAFLQTPSLAGVAGHISPLAVIGTDSARSDMLTPTLRKGWDTTYWGYPDGVEGYTPVDQKDPVTEALDDLIPNRIKGVCGWQKAVIGYQAPPLHGVWATAPYFHNGSVPTVEAVLNAAERHPIWQRQIETIGPVKGFDQSFAAYDFSKLGWKSTVLTCAQIPGNQLLNCNPLDDNGPSLIEMIQNIVNGTVAWAGLVTIPDPTPGGSDKRLVYDTRILGNGNGGHVFADVLTEQERKAVIEYLKTL